MKRLAEVLSSRAELNISVVSQIDKAAVNWGAKIFWRNADQDGGGAPPRTA